MKYLFESVENQDRLKIVIDSWLNPPTPYRHHCGVKGLGCDCIHFVTRVLVEFGILRWRKDLIPDYAKDWHLHNERQLLTEGLEREFKRQDIRYEKIEIDHGIDNLMNGDLTVAFYGKAISHAGFYFDGYVYQAINTAGVLKINLKDKVFRRQMQFAYRILT